MFIGPATTVGSWLVNQLAQSGSTTQASPTSTPSGTPSVTGPSATALTALSQVGIQAPNGSQALQSFMQNLFSALQAQGASATASISNATDTSSVGTVAGHKGSHGHGRLEQEVQGLIHDLNSSTASSSAPAGVSLGPLQQSFQSLVTASGSAGSNPTLGGFLAAFRQDLPSLGRVGNILNMQA